MIRTQIFEERVKMLILIFSVGLFGYTIYLIVKHNRKLEKREHFINQAFKGMERGIRSPRQNSKRNKIKNSSSLDRSSDPMTNQNIDVFDFDFPKFDHHSNPSSKLHHDSPSHGSHDHGHHSSPADSSSHHDSGGSHHSCSSHSSCGSHSCSGSSSCSGGSSCGGGGD